MSIGGITGFHHNHERVGTLKQAEADQPSASGDEADASQSGSATDGGAAEAAQNGSVLSAELIAQLLDLQAASQGADSGSGTGGSSTAGGTSPFSQNAQKLFNQIDTDGDGKITQSDVEATVIKDGGTKQDADALYAQLDPNNTGSLDEQQFAQALAPTASNILHLKQSADAVGVLNALTDLLNPPAPSAAAASGNAAPSGPDDDAAGTQNSSDLRLTIGEVNLKTGAGKFVEIDVGQGTGAGGQTEESVSALYAAFNPDGSGGIDVTDLAKTSFSQPATPGESAGETLSDALNALLDPNGTQTASATDITSKSGETAQQELQNLWRGTQA